ncbi:hypothetical protein EIL81_02000 [Photorhabdus laumondii subsp. laumondii]|uniref:Photorhabdus luminescens subsp. laumondii TTO1 complete genome segment 12/17 n=1 Tax=Photorhabdus laumondii subsp. laumondii (strain DSM 15139 / CIP 105565 / TT01) TaxID=243265 RepID=Q7N205_PHOLL|nr:MULTISPECIES: hypothetical protein [Photorhabdus]CAE15678.1 unnamed protein product [Photorhabdus laumondii subsp. laumondii TTO1]MCZ1247903.1 hypothetical protein [Photorhabdus laumondii subsp. laumondii]NDL18502.1 hypothetical protein [Photorhabdus laumondii subsp. laumondii]NDL50356.1 hypothetical protein [Photorhabdus laumondii subsp. laumondii]NDL54858.1 hypothetical protein [Photorhabdus laumondii subsp. laumondii]
MLSQYRWSIKMADLSHLSSEQAEAARRFVDLKFQVDTMARDHRMTCMALWVAVSTAHLTVCVSSIESFLFCPVILRFMSRRSCMCR